MEINKYLVCPSCGATYNIIDEDDKQEFCERCMSVLYEEQEYEDGKCPSGCEELCFDN